jgi:hypothetical protein
MLAGENALEVTRRVKQRLSEIQKDLPRAAFWSLRFSCFCSETCAEG